MTLVVAVVAAVVAVASYLTWLAARLDRLHVRCEAARASLDAQLVRRAAAAAALAAVPDADRWLPASRIAEVAGSAQCALAAGGLPGTPTPGVAAPGVREAAENALSRALRAALAAASAQPGPALSAEARHLLAELRDASARVGVARQFDTDAVRDSRAVRRRRLVRALRLAGGAPLPSYFEMDDTLVLPAPEAVRIASLQPGWTAQARP